MVTTAAQLSFTIGWGFSKWEPTHSGDFASARAGHPSPGRRGLRSCNGDDGHRRRKPCSDPQRVRRGRRRVLGILRLSHLPVLPTRAKRFPGHEARSSSQST